MKINRYKLKDGITIDNLKKIGFSEYDNEGNVLKQNFHLIDEIEVDIIIPTDLVKFDDFKNIDILDMDFCQPYTPFYEYWNKEVTGFKFLEKVIKRYNEVMDSIGVFEKITI